MKLIVFTDIHLGNSKSGDLEPFNYPEKSMDGLISIQDLISDYDMCVSLGDNIHNQDRETDLFNLKEVVDFLKNRSNEFISAVGNHELRNIKKEDVLKVFSNDGFFHIEKDDFSIVVLDTMHDGYEVFLGKEQLDWLKKILSVSREKVLLFSHAPCFDYDCSNNRWLSGRQGNARIKDYDTFIDIIRKSGNDVICISGHVHENSYFEIEGIPFITLQAFSENVDGKPCWSYTELLFSEEEGLRILNGSRSYNFWRKDEQ